MLMVGGGNVAPPPPMHAELSSRSAVGQAVSGVATWYGSDFQGSQMANGQYFDMWDTEAVRHDLPLTTASNRWPLGTVLLVTSTKTKKTVKVEVKDHGAFTHLLDLSYKAFSLLDDPDVGVEPIIVREVRGE